MNAKVNFLKNIFYDVRVSKGKNEFSIRCPYCGKPGKSKFCIRLDTDVYHCWVCEIKGRGLAKVIHKVNPSKVKEYKDKFDSSRKKFKETEEIEEIEINLPKDFKLLARANTSDMNYSSVYTYAVSRGFTIPTLWNFRIGFSNEYEWKRRLIIPSFDCDGNLNYLIGRAIDSGEYFKYKNEEKPKKKIIFNEIDIDWDKPLLISEGPLDLVKVNMNKTCLLGSTLKEDYLLFERIVRNNTPVILILDRDAEKKAIKIADLLYKYNINVKINFPPGDLDLNDMEINEINELINQSENYSYRYRIKLKIGNI